MKKFALVLFALVVVFSLTTPAAALEQDFTVNGTLVSVTVGTPSTNLLPTVEDPKDPRYFDQQELWVTFTRGGIVKFSNHKVTPPVLMGKEQNVYPRQTVVMTYKVTVGYLWLSHEETRYLVFVAGNKFWWRVQ